MNLLKIAMRTSSFRVSSSAFIIIKLERRKLQSLLLPLETFKKGPQIILDTFCKNVSSTFTTATFFSWDRSHALLQIIWQLGWWGPLKLFFCHLKKNRENPCKLSSKAVVVKWSFSRVFHAQLYTSTSDTHFFYDLLLFSSKSLFMFWNNTTKAY